MKVNKNSGKLCTCINYVMEVRAYSIYARFVDVSENEVVREAKE